MRSIVSGLGTLRLLAASLVLFSAFPVKAQTEEEIAGARSAALQGAKAFEAGDYVQAVDLFQRAESLVHAPPHLLYMARAHIKLGHLVTARELYNKIIRETLSDSAPQPFRDAQESARQEIKDVEPRLAKLTLVVQAPEGTKPAVTMDGKEVPPALLGVPRPVDPGEHVIEAKADGFLPAQHTSTLAEGGSDSVTLMLQPDPNAVAAAAPAAAAEPASTPPANEPATPEDKGAQAGSSLAVPAYIALGVGAVGLGAGVLFTLQSSNKRAEADDLFATCRAQGVDGECKESDPLSDEVASLDDEAGSARTMAIVGYALGGVGVAAGVTLLLLDGSNDESATEPSIRPWLGYRSAGVVGTF